MEQVMNNNDLRGIIFSFFRTNPHKQCQIAKLLLCGIKKKFYINLLNGIILSIVMNVINSIFLNP